jgi:hypothetical protein
MCASVRAFPHGAPDRDPDQDKLNGIEHAAVAGWPPWHGAGFMGMGWTAREI